MPTTQVSGCNSLSMTAGHVSEPAPRDPGSVDVSEPLRYLVVFHSDRDESKGATAVSPEIVTATSPHLLHHELISALPALWYCLHLPKTKHDLVDFQVEDLAALQDWAFQHSIMLVSSVALPEYLSHNADIPLAMLLASELDRSAVEECSDQLLLALRPVFFDSLSEASLHEHWVALGDALTPGLDGPSGAAIPASHDMLTAGLRLPTQRIRRQLGFKDQDPPDGDLEQLRWALHIQIYQRALVSLRLEGLSLAEARAQLELQFEAEMATYRVPVTVHSLGVARAHSRRFSSAMRPDSEAEAGAWPHTLGTGSDDRVEASAVSLIATHRALATDSPGLRLPDCPPSAFSALAELEKHWRQGASPSGVRRLLARVNRAMHGVWTPEFLEALEFAESLVAFSNFPIGLVTPPGATSPLACAVPIAYRHLLPVSGALLRELTEPVRVDWDKDLKVLVLECIPADDAVGAASRGIWQWVQGRFLVAGGRVSLVYREALSELAIREAVQAEAPDVLVISAHGFVEPLTNSAGIVVGTSRSFGIGLGPLPPLVVLSSCHVSPRGTSSASVADRLLQEGATAVMGTLVPVDVRRNAILLQRFLLILNEAIEGSAPHGSILDLWHRVQATNAFHDVITATDRLEDWAMSPVDGAPSPHRLFKTERAEGIRLLDLYAEIERILLEIADERGTRSLVRSWLSRGYLPESAFYVLIGAPELIHLRPPVSRWTPASRSNRPSFSTKSGTRGQRGETAALGPTVSP